MDIPQQNTQVSNPPPGQMPPTQTPPPPITKPENPPAISPPKEKATRNFSPYFFALILFVIGIGLGFLLFKTFPAKTLKSIPQTKNLVPADITVPKDFIQIQSCISHKGKMFSNSKNSTKEPIYLVDKEKVIGIEYWISQNEYQKGGTFAIPPTLNSKVDPITVGSYIAGSNAKISDKNDPFYFVDLYLVKKDVEQAIICPAEVTFPTLSASPSAEVTPSEILTPIVSVEPSPSIEPTTLPNISPTQ
jgi:hypothetical protein